MLDSLQSQIAYTNTINTDTGELMVLMCKEGSRNKYPDAFCSHWKREKYLQTGWSLLKCLCFPVLEEVKVRFAHKLHIIFTVMYPCSMMTISSWGKYVCHKRLPFFFPSLCAFFHKSWWKPHIAKIILVHSLFLRILIDLKQVQISNFNN